MSYTYVFFSRIIKIGHIRELDKPQWCVVFFYLNTKYKQIRAN